MSLMRLFFCTFFALTLLAQRQPAAQLPQMSPKTVFEPAKAAAAQSLADSTAASPKHLLTLAERTNYAETARYAESLALARRMEKASPWIKVVTFGKTPQGRDLFAVIASKEGLFSPAAARATGKPVILLQSCIHPGEVDGKEASEMLLRDVAITKRYAAWLDKVILVSIPIFNVDGHENFTPYTRINQDGPKAMGFRATAQRLNLNRDFLKADAPEMRAWLKFFSSWLPDFFLDNHVTDGADFQYDVTIDAVQNQEIWPSVGRWVRERYLPSLEDAMATDGHVMGWYGFFFDGAPRTGGGPGMAALSLPAGTTGFAKSTYTPRFSHGYAAVQNRPALLVETHSLKSFKTRTWAHYNIMKRSIEAIVRDPKALKDAVREADQAMARLAGTSETLYLDGKLDFSKSKPYTFRTVKSSRPASELAGGPVPVYQAGTVDIPTKLFDQVETTVSASVPAGYVIPAEWTELIDRVQAHGLPVERAPREVEVEGESWTFSNVRFPPQPFEGRFNASFQSHRVAVKRSLPAGSVWVPANHRAARVVLNLLEPDAPDSLIRWGFLHAIFEQKEYFSDYVMEPIAREMAKRHPELKAQFDERVAKDAAFAKNARARLAWWFERSPYYEPDKDAYPVIRVAKRPW